MYSICELPNPDKVIDLIGSNSGLQFMEIKISGGGEIMAKEMLSEKVANHILKIIEDSYEPGDRIPPELELSKSLNVSRATVREAIKSLCSRNILEVRRGIGTFVCDEPGVTVDALGTKSMDPEEVKYDIFEISEMFEPMLIKLSAEKATKEDLAKMKEVELKGVYLFHKHKNENNLSAEEFRKIDVEQHKAFISGCHNQIAINMIPMVLSACSEWHNVLTEIGLDNAIKSNMKYHPKILAAIKAHDAEAAYRYSLEHTQEIKAIFMDIKSQKATSGADAGKRILTEDELV